MVHLQRGRAPVATFLGSALVVQGLVGTDVAVQAGVFGLALAPTAGNVLVSRWSIDTGVALLDLQLPGPDGIEVARRLATQLPDCRCIIVTSYARPGY